MFAYISNGKWTGTGARIGDKVESSIQCALHSSGFTFADRTDGSAPSTRDDRVPDRRPQADEPTAVAQDDVPRLETQKQRTAVRFLIARNGPVKMGKIAEYVAAHEYETTVDQLETEQRLDAYVPLYQSFLPELDRFGLIEYDQCRGVVYPTDRLEELEPQLERAPQKRTMIASD